MECINSTATATATTSNVESSIETNKASIKKLKDLKEEISNLELCEQSEILKIIEKNNIKFTENKNGIFINMNKLTSKTIEEIECFLVYIKNNYKKKLI